MIIGADAPIGNSGIIWSFCFYVAPAPRAARGLRLAVSQHAALTPLTGHRWWQERLNPVKGFALLPPTPLPHTPPLLYFSLEASHQLVKSASGHY